MGEVRHVIEMAILSIEQTTGLFYQQKIEQGYKQLENTLTILAQAMNDIFSYKLDGNDIGIDEKQLIEVLTEAMKAMEVKDTVLLSDILEYDLKELFNEVLASV